MPETMNHQRLFCTFSALKWECVWTTASISATSSPDEMLVEITWLVRNKSKTLVTAIVQALWFWHQTLSVQYRGALFWLQRIPLPHTHHPALWATNSVLSFSVISPEFPKQQQNEKRSSWLSPWRSPAWSSWPGPRWCALPATRRGKFRSPEKQKGDVGNQRTFSSSQ